MFSRCTFASVENRQILLSPTRCCMLAPMLRPSLRGQFSAQLFGCFGIFEVADDRVGQVVEENHARTCNRPTLPHSALLPILACAVEPAAGLASKWRKHAAGKILGSCHRATCFGLRISNFQFIRTAIVLCACVCRWLLCCCLST